MTVFTSLRRQLLQVQGVVVANDGGGGKAMMY